MSDQEAFQLVRFTRAMSNLSNPWLWRYAIPPSARRDYEPME
jgi:hypothetical protein